MKIPSKIKFYFGKYSFEDHHPKNMFSNGLAWLSRSEGKQPERWKHPAWWLSTSFFCLRFGPCLAFGTQKSTAQLSCDIFKPI